MPNKVNDFETGGRKVRQNLEVENAKQQLALLRRLDNAKTKDEMHTIVQQIDDEDLLDVLINTLETPHGLIPKLEMAISKDEFRPRNQSLISFATNPDLEYINGDFSTATPGRKVTQETDRDALRALLARALSNTKNISKQYAADILYHLDPLPKYIVNAALDGNLYAYETLLATIARELIKTHGDKNSIIRLEIEVLPGNSPQKTCAGQNLVFVNKKTSEKKHKIIIYPDNIIYLLNKISKKFRTASQIQQQQMIFSEIFATFAHEFGHVIDRANPNRGALGAQTSYIGEKIYDDTTPTKYFSNPTEISSHKIEDQTRSNIAQWLQQKNNHE